MMDPLKTYRYDKVLLFSVLALTVMGVIMVYSSTALMSLSQGKRLITAQGDYQFFFLKRHIMTLAISVTAMLIFYRLTPRHMKAIAIPLLVIAVLMLLAVFIPGVGLKINGARRWLKLWPSTFQPSEFAKFAMVFFLAKYLAETEDAREKFKTFIIPIAVMGVIQLILLRQPDFGSAFTLGVITVSVLFIAGTPVRYLLLFVVAAVPVLVALLMEPYRLKRLLIFIDPWKDPYGSGFQLVQSFIALGSGGLKGVGLGAGRQKLSFLPEINTDFIFSLIGEELGLIGVSLVLLFFALFFVRGIRIAGRARSPFSFYLSMGLVLMITLQALINVAVVTGLVPTKGLPLPFISYGGSALLVSYMSVGILLRLSKAEPEQYSLATTQDLIKRRARLKARMIKRRAI